MYEKPVITFDCEWAPDVVLDYVSSILIDNNIKSTWFVTNDSPVIQKMRKNSLFELGIHPNFFPGSTQGGDPDSVLTYCKKIVPEARSVRTHRLLQSSPLLMKFHEFELENDVSMLLEKTPNLTPHYSEFYKIYRFPFFWEDDVQLNDSFSWSFNESIFHVNGLKILNFHPILIFLNSKNLKNYNLMQKEIGIEKLNEKNSQKFINKDKVGELKFFKDIVSFLHNENTHTIQDLQKMYFTNDA